MEKALVTAATIGLSGSFTLTRSAAKAHTGTPRIALLEIAQHTNDITTAVNTLETSQAAHVANIANPHAVTKLQVGLGLVDNTSDANKPISSAQQTALNSKVAEGSQVFNVKTYGAVGNGVANDTAAIQAAITAAQAIQGTVFLPPGTYKLTATLNIGGAISFVGSGWSTILDIPNSFNQDVINFNIVGVGAMGWVFKDFKIQGNGNNQASGNLIKAYGAIHCVFDHIWFNKPCNNSLYLLQDGNGGTGHHNKVTNCLFDQGNQSVTGDGRAILIEGSDENYFTNNDFEANGRPGAGEPNQVFDKSGLQSFLGNVFVGGETAIKVQGQYTKIIGNMFDGINRHCIRLNGNGNIITNNQFFQVGFGNGSHAYDGVLIDNSTGNNISNNQFLSDNSGARYGVSFLYGASGNTAVNNVFTVQGSGFTANYFTDGGTNLSETIPFATQVSNILAAPSHMSLSGSQTGGSLAAANYYYKITATHTSGVESNVANEDNYVVSSATGSVVVSWPLVTGATGYKIYRGISNGAQTLYYSVGAVTSYTDTGAASTAGTPPSTHAANVTSFPTAGDVRVVGKVTNVTDPTTAQDAATKHYVDTKSIYYVKDYGALANGTTDDTAAIQAALNAAYTAGGGIVQLATATSIVDPNPGLQVKTNVILQGSGAGSILKLKASSIRNDNIVKAESWNNVVMRDFTIDGNRTNQAGTPGAYTYTQYGVYIAGTSNSVARNVNVKNMTGVGIHVYNSPSVVVENCFSSGNNYHGYEFEQATGCHLLNSRGNSNLLHGLLTSPGEVAGTGSKGNSVIGCTFDGNTQYGIAMNAANANVSAWLNEGNIYIGNTVTNNGQYGVNFFMQDKHVFNDNYVAGNGFFGLYAFKSSANSIQNNTFVNNSQAGNGSYDEILLEGNSSGHASANNNISGNTIIVSGAIKARYAISEATSGDGPNIIVGNNIPTAGTSGKLNVLNTTTIQYVDTTTAQIIKGAKEFVSTVTADQGLAVAPNATLSGTVMGVDAPFGAAVLRMYNNNSGGNLQFVAPNGTIQNYVNGNDIMDITSTGVQVNSPYVLQTTKFKITTGVNASAGTGALIASTITIATTAVTASSLIFLTNTSGSTGQLSVGTKTVGTSFVVNSSLAADTSTFNWMIIN